MVPSDTVMHMSLFSRFRKPSSDVVNQRSWESSTSDDQGLFVITDVFVITGRGPVFTGIMESGSLGVGDAVIVDITHDSPDASPKPSPVELHGTISAIESRHRRTQSIQKGDEAGLIIRGVNVDDLPYTRNGSGFALDTKALNNRMIRKANTPAR